MEMKKLPGAVLKLLEGYDIRKDDILLSALTDRNLEGSFAKGYLVLARDRLAIVTSGPEEGELFYFKGISVSDDQEGRKKNWACTIITLSALAELDVIRTVSGGVLYASYSREADDADRQLAAFTNRCIGGALRITALFARIREGKEMAEDDIQEEREECCPKCGALYPDQERKICPKCMDRRSIFLRTLLYFKPYAGKIFLMVLCYLATAALNLAWPYLSGTILYDRVLSGDETFLALLGLPGGRYITALLFIVITMVLTKVILQAVGILQGIMTAQVVPDVVRDMKSEVFRSMGRLSVSFYNNRQTGGLMTRVMGDAEQVTSFFFDGLPYLIINILSILAMASVMFLLNWRMALAALFLIPALFFISLRMQPRLWSFYGRRHRAERSLNARLNDNITGARVVKSFGQEENEVKRFEGSSQKLKNAELSIVSYDNRFFALYASVEQIAFFLVWVLGAFLLLFRGDMELGVLITFTGYVGQLSGPLNFMSHAFRWWADSLNSAQRMFEIIDAVPEVTEKNHPVRLSGIKGDIELDQVTFGYEPHKPVLKQVSLKIEAGKMLGIVGRSGAGKSTLVQLISRLYDPKEGNIYLDGINIRDIAFEDLRRNVAMVSQETYIFMGTVRENIAYANQDATLDDIVQAAVLASAHDFICRMPDGYDTVIGSSGRSLSGGERQRISIARAILADPRILILDEATASVDTETEKAIQASINYLIKGRTTISIAHRLSTLRNADHLVVIDDGRVVEEGTHSELTEQKGTYYKLRELQTKALALKGLE